MGESRGHQGFKSNHADRLAADGGSFGPLMNDINIRSLKGGKRKALD
jgi:hypothetical protein